MPIFDYSCQACGHSFDMLQKLGADPLTDCPECGQPELEKLLSAPAFHLKGKGWRNSDDTPKKPFIRPKFAHTLDSPVAHAEHKHDGPSTATEQSHDKGHGHSQNEQAGGVGKIVREHVHGHSHSHAHDKPEKDSGKKSDSHGHKHDH